MSNFYNSDSPTFILLSNRQCRICGTSMSGLINCIVFLGGMQCLPFRYDLGSRPQSKYFFLPHPFVPVQIWNDSIKGDGIITMYHYFKMRNIAYCQRNYHNKSLFIAKKYYLYHHALHFYLHLCSDKTTSWMFRVQCKLSSIDSICGIISVTTESNSAYP